MERPWQSFAVSAGRGLFFLAAALGVMVVLLGENGIRLSPVVSEFICAILAAVFFLHKKAGPVK